MNPMTIEHEPQSTPSVTESTPSLHCGPSTKTTSPSINGSCSLFNHIQYTFEVEIVVNESEQIKCSKGFTYYKVNCYNSESI